nr:MAG TPA: hypothetical protein [Bacteriophage sp.]
MGTTYYYESQPTNYAPYLAHYGVKGMKWGVRHDPVTLMGNLHQYRGNLRPELKGLKGKYRREKGMIKTQRNKGLISDTQYTSKMQDAKLANRRNKSQTKLEARKKYYSNVSQARGIAGSILLDAGGRKISMIGQQKAMESIVAQDGKRKVAAYMGLAVAGGLASTAGQYGGYLEVRRGIDKYKGRVR